MGFSSPRSSTGTHGYCVDLRMEAVQGEEETRKQGQLMQYWLAGWMEGARGKQWSCNDHTGGNVLCSDIKCLSVRMKELEEGCQVKEG